jgi:hypothetical protein
VKKRPLSSAFLIAVFFCGLVLVSTVQFSMVKASTDVSGLISSDTTWTSAGSPYLVTGDVLVNSGVVLTIAPGVVVKFGAGTSLFVDGTLVVNGDEAQPVTFSSNKATPTPGDWGTINFRGSSAESILKWASISYASDGVTVTAGSPTLEHCSVSNNQRYGVYVSAGAPTIVKTTIYENGKDGIWNYVGTVTVTNCTISSNKGNGIYKDSKSITVQDSLIAHNLQSGIYGGAGGQFTVSNCTVSYNGYDGVTICYSNMAITNSEITYNNRDGVRMESGTLSGSAKIAGNKISHNSGNGVYKSSGSMQLTYNNITFNNVGIAATPFKLVFSDSFQEQSGDTIIDYNNIVDNSVYAVENIGPGTNTRGTVLNLTATNNWWGTTDTSLIDQLIRDVKDDFGLGKVEYVPFLGAPASAPTPSPSPSPEPSPTPTPTPPASITTPSVPEFTMKYVELSYEVPPEYGIDPYTGEKVVTQEGYHVENQSVVFKIKNQSFTPYNDTSGNNICLYYNFRFKGHYVDDEWQYYPFSESGQGTRRYSAMFYVLIDSSPKLAASNSEYTEIIFSLPFLLGESPPVGSQIDFQVQALIGHIDSEGSGYYSYTGQTSDWSSTYTITTTIGESQTPTVTPSPSPIPVPGQSFFYVKSNSTVSELFFNSTSAELSFTVNGTSGTSGYVEITIAKSLVANVQNVKVYLDGDQLNVAITDNEDSWLLTFTYMHSTHNVLVSLAANEPEHTVLDVNLILIAVVAVIAITGVAGFMVWRKKNKA